MMQRKKIDLLIIGINFYPELTGIGKYTQEMANWFCNQGMVIEIVTGYPYYPSWKLEKSEYWYRTKKHPEFNYKIHRCPLYVPQKPSGKLRLVHEFSFLISSLLKVLWLCLKIKPKSVLCIAPPFHLGFLGIVTKSLTGANLIYHIQDLQIEAALALGMIKGRGFEKLLFRLEKYILAKSNFISTIHQNMARIIALKINHKNVLLLPNWIDTQILFPISNSSVQRKKYGLPTDKTIIMYSGSVGEKQGLERILNLAEQFKENDGCLFIIAGMGPFLKALELQCKAKKIRNILFRDLVPAHELNEWLNIADFHLLYQKDNTSQLLYPSKLVSILGTGGICIAIVSKYNPIGQLLLENEMGISLMEDDVQMQYHKIMSLKGSDLSVMRKNARNFAVENYDFKSLINDWAKNTNLT